MLVPLWYVLVTSVTPFDIWVRTGGTLFIAPGSISLDAYRQLLSGAQLPRAFGISLYITLLGTALNLVFTTLLAYPLSKDGFRLRTPLLALVVFTLLFNGGLIPTYLVVRDLHLLNTYWALMLPNLVSAFNLLLMRAFFHSLPTEIEEAARIDGASEWQILWRIVLPLSKPILATIGLFYAVAHWNGFFDAILYLSDANMQPLQVVLRSILNAGQLAEFTDVSSATAVPTETLQMAAVVLTTIPVLLIYPFLQRYFTAGTLLGAVKE
jgi:putative aldouronate transport system permease protein